MLCERCQEKPATVFMQKNVNGAKSEMHLCQDCSAIMESPMMQMPPISGMSGLSGLSGLSIEALLNGLLGSIIAVPIEKAVAAVQGYSPCPTCQMTFEEFKNSGGKFGCAECYHVFSRELESILKNVQTSVKHEGKFPKQYGGAMFNAREAIRLRELMQKAISDENFEEAARLRDSVRAIEASRDGATGATGTPDAAVQTDTAAEGGAS